MAAKQPEQNEEEQIKRRLLWKKVSDPTFVEDTSKPKKTIYQSSSLGKAGVPMIPENLLGGSQDGVTENKVFRNMSMNPLVPIGMLLTTGCLVGMMKASLNRNMLRTQYYMRGRIAAQFFTVCVLVGGAAMFGLDPRGYSKPGAVPKEPDSITKAFLNNNN